MMKTLKYVQYVAVVLYVVVTLWGCSEGEYIIPENTAAPIHFTIPDNWGDDSSATRVITEGNKTTFEPGKDKIGVYAYYPYIETVNDGQVAIDINVKNHIMWTNTVNGENTTSTDNRFSYTGESVEFNFRHLLNRLRIKFMQGKGYPDGKTVTDVKVEQVHNDTTWEDNFNLDETIQKTKYSHKKS